MSSFSSFSDNSPHLRKVHLGSTVTYLFLSPIGDVELQSTFQYSGLKERNTQFAERNIFNKVQPSTVGSASRSKQVHLVQIRQLYGFDADMGMRTWSQHRQAASSVLLIALSSEGSSPAISSYQLQLSPINSSFIATAELVSSHDGVLKHGFSIFETVDILNRQWIALTFSSSMASS